MTGLPSDSVTNSPSDPVTLVKLLVKRKLERFQPE
jgi:hypothetical protein